ncbi:DUF4347 domain-containing protein [Galbibacter sp. PAP.153]|uniref:DUF4347 domain-containing protein n=1 Tax=Galbibacter sp. PAP.153 TaxID=3104623 RepID=UPI00300B4175
MSKPICPNAIQNVYVDMAVQDQEIFHAAVTHNMDSSVYHLFSHGKSGELFIDGKWLGPKEIVKFLQPKIEQASSTIKYINIYGCEFAKGPKGREALKYLENKLNVSVAASINLTGKDGDWELEAGENPYVWSFLNYNYNLQCTEGYSVITGSNLGTNYPGTTSVQGQMPDGKTYTFSESSDNMYFSVINSGTSPENCLFVDDTYYTPASTGESISINTQPTLNGDIVEITFSSEVSNIVLQTSELSKVQIRIQGAGITGEQMLSGSPEVNFDDQNSIPNRLLPI